MAEKVLKALSHAAGCIDYFTDGTKNGIKKALDKAGLDKAVVLNIATNPEKHKKINDAALALNDDSIIGFGSIHPAAPDCMDELERIAEMGLKGIKLHPEYQNFQTDDPKMFPIYEKIGSLGLITVFHAGYDDAYMPPPKCTPQSLSNALPYFGGATVVAAHMGSYMMWKEVYETLCGRDIYFDTSFCFSRIPKPLMAAIIKKHGTDRILFGSDSPWGDMEKEIRLIDSLELPQKDYDMIMGGNAERLLFLNNY